MSDPTADEPSGGAAPSGASSPAARRMVGGRNLPVAIGVGVGLAALFLATLFWHPAAFALVVAGLITVAYLESARVLRRVGTTLLFPVLAVSAYIMLLGAYQARHAGQAIGVLVLVLGAVLWLLAEDDRRDVVRSLSATVLFGLWVGFLGSYAVLLANRPDGTLVTLAVIGSAIVTDIGGYAFGVTLGRHRVAPGISPNKTWEGLLGGVAAAVALAAVVLPLLGDTFTPARAAGLAAACGAAGFVGDLTESMFKRDLGVKDLGAVLPGHGGILDRVDGILFALPVGYYVVELLAAR